MYSAFALRADGKGELDQPYCASIQRTGHCACLTQLLIRGPDWWMLLGDLRRTGRKFDGHRYLLVLRSHAERERDWSKSISSLAVKFLFRRPKRACIVAPEFVSVEQLWRCK